MKAAVMRLLAGLTLVSSSQHYQIAGISKNRLLPNTEPERDGAARMKYFGYGNKVTGFGSSAAKPAAFEKAQVQFND